MRKFFGQAFDNMVRVELVLDPDPPPEVMAATQGVEKLLLKEKNLLNVSMSIPIKSMKAALLGILGSRSANANDNS